jgi:glycine betaine/proline transport system substrate-binding protein
VSGRSNRRAPSSPRDLLAGLTALLAVLLVVLLSSGCGEANSAASPDAVGPSGEKVTLGYVGWEESVAVSNLTKVLLEDLGYKEVELRRFERPEAAYRAVAGGEIDAFQAVWLPTHEHHLGSVEDDVQLLGSWLIGTTRSSLAVPSYMGVRSIDGLRASGAEKLVGAEPGAAPIETPDRLPAGLDLERDLYPDTRAMFDEVGRLYGAREPFAFVAWSPHWSNEEYEFEYVEDPERLMGDLTQPARVHVIVSEDLEDPLALALMDAIFMAEHQVQGLELAIREAGNASEGTEAWVQDHENLARHWTDTARARAGRA